MSLELLLLRHGKSDWDRGTTDDFDRPLANRGRKAVKRMGRWLQERGLLPDRIISSPAARAKQTALRLCRHAGVSEDIVSWEEAIYGADVDTLLEVLAACQPEAGRLMIVGHNPGFEDLVEYLSGQPITVSSRGPAFPTAALAHLAMPDDWRRLERGCARLTALIRPRELQS